MQEVIQTEKKDRFIIQNSEGVDRDSDEKTFAEASILGYVEVPQSPTSHILARENAQSALQINHLFLLIWGLATEIEKAVAEQRGEIIAGKCAWCERQGKLAKIKTGDPEVEELVCESCMIAAGAIQEHKVTVPVRFYRTLEWEGEITVTSQEEAEQVIAKMMAEKSNSDYHQINEEVAEYEWPDKEGPIRVQNI